MEYVFGSRERGGVIQDILKTKADKHTSLSGNVEVERKYDDSIITDSFTIVNKYQSKKDKAGNCYDWYVIANHYRYIDKYTPNISKVEEKINGDISDTQAGLLETYDLTAGNTEDIAECRAAVEEIFEMIANV